VVVTLFPLELELLHLISLPPQFLYPCLKTNIMCLVPLCHNSLCKIDFSWNYLNLDMLMWKWDEQFERGWSLEKFMLKIILQRCIWGMYFVLFWYILF
jgi:hypothetical protein